MFPVGSQQINADLGFERRGDQITYFNGHLPVFTHEDSDLQSFRLFTTQLIVNGTATQGEIVKAFGISSTTVKRCVKQYRQGGIKAMFVAPRRRQGTKLNAERLAQAQQMLDLGQTVPAISEALGVLATTLHKAIDSGRLRLSQKTKPEQATSSRASTQSERGVVDQVTPLGVATSRTEERVLASLGKVTEVPLRFERCDDVPNGGVICALPALLAVGLLCHVRDYFSWPKGYYPMETIFLSLAYLALARVRSMEALRYEPPGEWGKLLGLDRIPEVKTIREKIAVLCQDPSQSAHWSSRLAQDWMALPGDQTGFYYVDGHVRVYHGSAAHRPKAYVAREQLCLRATLDYWVNAMDGQPFFVVTQELNERLIQTLEQDIVPRLKAQASRQPTPEQLEANHYLHRFVLVFDREGYSPEFFRRLWQERIAILSYAKRCKATEDWPAEEFAAKTVLLINGQSIEFSMAERGVRLSNDYWVREVRHRDEQGHQTAIITTDWIDSMEKVVAALYARWCQENFFRYMIEHYSFDRLVQYGTEPLPDTSMVVNPARRILENEIRRERSLLNRQRARLNAKTMPAEASTREAAAFEQKQGELLQAITDQKKHLDELKARRGEVPTHVAMKDLRPEDRFTALRSDSKHFIDTIKMIAYRAETALLGVARQNLQRSDDARAWIQQVLQSSANLIPDCAAKTLTVQIHPLTNRVHNQALQQLCTTLTDTETVYPNTDLRLVFQFLEPS
jgi:transposase